MMERRIMELNFGKRVECIGVAAWDLAPLKFSTFSIDIKFILKLIII